MSQTADRPSGPGVLVFFSSLWSVDSSAYETRGTSRGDWLFRTSFTCLRDSVCLDEFGGSGGKKCIANWLRMELGSLRVTPLTSRH